MQLFDAILQTQPATPLLDQVDTPSDVRALAPSMLVALADELRAFMIYAVGNTGGHFASGLGVVELTIALHYVFDTPRDLLIWDVGHQAYPHKILTQRKDRIHTIRQKDGLAPFTDPNESIFDVAIAGHASTSISHAVGMRIAEDARGNNNHIVAVIGDGALTGGMSFEALNHAGALKQNLTVVLNDNAMSISDNVGALARHFSAFFASPVYQYIRDKQQGLSSLLKHYETFVHKSEQQLKGLVLPHNMFEQLGFQYFGPIDGHDLPFVIRILEKLKQATGPTLLHVVTKKGKGFVPAEKNPIGFHAINQPRATKPPQTKSPVCPNYANVFGQWLVNKAQVEKRLHAITPAMCEGSDLIAFRKQFPKRYHDVGIAEQHALTLAAGMSLRGLKPVVAIYSTFLQRAYDQYIHDLCLQKADVLLAIDRAGIVGGDGATHHGVFDIAYLRTVPNCIILAASDGNELVAMLEAGYNHPGVVAVRYPRGAIPQALSDDVTELRKQPIAIGVAQSIKLRPKQQNKPNGVILSFGAVLDIAHTLAEKHALSLVNMRSIKPLDMTLLARLCQEYDYFVTIEEHVRTGGAGSAVLEACAHLGMPMPTCVLGLDDVFYAHGTPASIKEDSLSYAACKRRLNEWHQASFKKSLTGETCHLSE